MSGITPRNWQCPPGFVLSIVKGICAFEYALMAAA